MQTRVGNGLGVSGEEGGKVPVTQGEEVVQVTFAPTEGGEDFLLGSSSARALGQELVLIPGKEQIYDEGRRGNAHGDTAELPDEDGAKTNERGGQETAEDCGEVGSGKTVCGLLFGVFGTYGGSGTVAEMGIGLGRGVGVVWVSWGVYNGDVCGICELQALGAHGVEG